MNSNNDFKVPKYKECAGRGCKNSGINIVKIKYIHKSGWFCNSCKNDLREDGLIDTAEKEVMA